MPKITNCEVASSSGIRIMGISEALLTSEKHGNCPHCHQPVRPHKTGSTGQAAHFEHRNANPDCPLSSGSHQPKTLSYLQSGPIKTSAAADLTAIERYTD